ncbi:MAG: small multi-drug export protein [Dehalococcoidia bacterium]|nr:small multi-drug export protein [Dehalococcoidia bacterium]
MTFENLVAVLLVAASPIAELRAAVPMAIHLYHYPWPAALLVSLAGNLVPIPFILLLLKPLTRLAEKIKPLRLVLEFVFSRARKRSDMVRKYERLGLMLFVAIPLPGSGAWTGSIIAYLLELRFATALLFISLGVLMAGIVVTVLSLLGWLGAIIAGVALAVATFLWLRKKV